MKLYFPILLVCFASLAFAQSVPRARQPPARGQGPHTDTVPEKVVRDKKDLVNNLKLEIGTDGENAAGSKAYAITASPTTSYDWIVGSIDDCEREIGPSTPIGSTLICDAKLNDTCTREVTYRDDQSTSNTIGFQWEFGVEAGGKLGGLVEVKLTQKIGGSGSTTHTANQGVDNKYTFPVPPGHSCTPSIVSYRMSCKATSYTVNHDPWNTKGPYICTGLNINFAGKNSIFKGLSGRYHYYVNQGKLYEMISTSDFPPSGCDTVEGGKVWVRDMVLSKSDPTAKQPLFYFSGKSLSAIDCVLVAK